MLSNVTEIGRAVNLRMRLAVSAAIIGAAVLAAGSTLAQSPKDTTVRVALSAGLDLLDPGRSANGTDWIVMSQIYETLLDLDPANSALKPNLATEFRLKSPTVWEFKLRPGVKFHDGKPFTAADVKYSIERLLNPDTASPHFSQLTTIKSVTEVDDLTVEIETKAPDPVLPRRMQPFGGSGRVFIVPKHYFEANSKQQVNDAPIGTGPYKIGEWRKGQSVTLLRNDDYWGPKPQSAKGVFTFIPENSTRVNALLNGEVDIVQRIPISDVERVEKSPNAHVVASQDGLVHTLLLDSRKPPFDDINVRKAFAHALNMDNIVKNLLGKYGRTVGVSLAPTVSQFDPTLKPYKYDRNLAKELLAKKGPIQLETFTSDGRYVADRDFYQAINAQLASAGIRTKPQQLEWGRLISMMQNRSGGPFYIIGWAFDEGDASKMNSFLKSNSSLSVTNDPEYDALADQAGAELDEAKRTALWKKAQKLVYDRYYVAAVWQAASIYGFAKNLDAPGLVGDGLKLSGVTISQ